jgi:excisionase family DNA binding protein
VKPNGLAELGYDGFHRLDLPDWLGRVVARLPKPLADDVWAGVHGEPVVRSLTDAELNAITIALSDSPLRCEAEAVWMPFDGLHRRAIECVPQVRAMWTQQTAEEWTRDSAEYGVRLCEPNLPLSDGVAVVHEWLLCIRRLTRRAATARAEQIPPALEPTGATVCGWREAMRLTGLKKTKLYELFRDGRLKGYKDGGMIRFYRTGLAGYMKERENVVAPSPAPAPPRKPRANTLAAGTRFKFLSASGSC